MAQPEWPEQFVERDVLYALGRALASDAIGRGSRAPALLHYVVTEELAGRGDRLKAYTIGVDVCGKPSDFDPQADSSVRVEMGRLRKALAEFYESPEARGLLKIDIPVGTYRPRFEGRTVSIGNLPDSLFQLTQASSSSRFCTAVMAVALLVALGLAAAAWWLEGDQRAALAEPFFGTRLAVSDFAPIGEEAITRLMAATLGAEVVERLSGISWLSAFHAKAQSIEGMVDGPVPDFWLQGVLLRRTDRHELILSLHSRDQGKVVNRQVVTLESDRLPDARIDPSVTSSILATIATLGDQPLPPENGMFAETIPRQHCFVRLHDLQNEIVGQDLQALRQCTTDALAADPAAAGDWALLAQLDLHQYKRARLHDPGLIDKARDAAARAFQLAPNDPAALSARYATAAAAPERDLATFKHAADKAVAARPNDPDLLADYANKLVLYAGADQEHAARLAARALSLNTAPPSWYWWAPAMLAMTANRHAEAFDLSRKAGGENAPWANWVKMAAAARYGHASAALEQVAVSAKYGVEKRDDLIETIRTSQLSAPLATVLEDGVYRAFDMAAGAKSTVANAHAQRPARPVIYLPVAGVDPALSHVVDYLRLIISSFDSMIMRELVPPGVATPNYWPEEYELRLRHIQLTNQVHLEIVHLRTRTIIVSRTLPNIAGAAAFDRAQQAYQIMATSLFSARGQVASHYIEQDDLPDALKCLHITYQFYQTQDRDAFAKPFECINETIAAGTKDPGIYINKAILTYIIYLYAEDDQASGLLEQALQAAQKAAELQPGHRMASAALAWLYHLLDDQERSRKRAELAMAGGIVDPDVIALASRAECLHGDPKRCLAQMKRIDQRANLAPPWQDFQRLLAYYRLGDMAEAARQSRLLSGDRSSMVLAVRAAIASRTGDKELAKRLVDELVNVLPNAPDVLVRTLNRRNLDTELSDRILSDLANLGFTSTH